MNFEEVKYRGEWRWNTYSSDQNQYLDGLFIKTYKIANPRNRGGGAKKRRGSKWKGLGKRELAREYNISLLHSLHTWQGFRKGAKANYIRNAVENTINKN